MGEREAQAYVFRKEDTTRLRYESPPRTVYIWLDGSVGTQYLDFGTVDLAPGEYPPEHSHAVPEEVMWVHRGRGIVRINGKEFPVEEGVVVFAPPGVRHQFVNTGDEMMTIAYAFSPSATEAQFQLRGEGTASKILSSGLPAPGTPAPAGGK